MPGRLYLLTYFSAFFVLQLFTLFYIRIMLFIVGLPVVQTIIFYYAIGHDPTNLKLSVSNHEMSEEMISQQFCPPSKGCNHSMLSCRYLNYLINNKSMILVSIV